MRISRLDNLAPSPSRRSGFVLILVLALLVLITGLVVAFFCSVTSESKVTQSYSNESGADFLQQIAINIAEGQIAQSTNSGNATNAPGAPLTWASQPGMIRTYGVGNMVTGSCYKLYSSRNMVIAGDSNTIASETAADVPANWNTQPALYTDLNSPVTDASGNLDFPIIDGTFQTVTIGGTSCFTYSTSGTSPDIEGFSIPVASVPTYDSTKPLGATNNTAPMPVQWLYVLQDGSIVAPDPSSSGSSATFTSGTNPPTATNPITGRIAFWTDDETCKLNINTACEGTPYAFPHTDTPTDLGAATAMTNLQNNPYSFGFALSPPAEGEYNRYPGHPATTCLSVALGKWFGNNNAVSAPTAYTNSKVSISQYLTSLSSYFSITPRYSGTGSNAGTTVATTGTAGLNNPSYQAIPPSGMPKSDRLFDSVDELLFSPARSVPSQFAGTTGTANAAIERLKFFLTANSRAPEVTPLNTPKVSMWPQWDTLSHRTVPAGSWAPPGLKAADALLAYCSSFGTSSSSPSGKNEYFVQRYNQDPLTSSPPENIGWRSSRWDWDNEPRNQQLGRYLYGLGSNPIPGYGAAFTTATGAVYGSAIAPPKYSKTAYSSLIIQTLDNIRCFSDMADYYTFDGIDQNYKGAANLQFVEPLVMSGTSPGALPTNSGTTTLRGFGTRGVCTQAVLGVTVSGTTVTPYLFLEMFQPGIAFPNSGGGYFLNIYPISNLLSFGSQIVMSPSNAAVTSGTFSGEAYDIPAGGYEGTDAVMKIFYVNSLPSCYITSTNSLTAISLGGQPVSITFVDNTRAPVHVLNVTFPQVTVPMPTASKTTNYSLLFNYSTALAPSSITPNTASIFSARGIECGTLSPLLGDWRLLGAIFSPDTGTFEQSNANTAEPGDYSNRNYAQVHTLRAYVGGDVNQTGTTDRLQPICVDGTSGTVSSGTATVYIAGSLVSGLKNTDYPDYSAPCAPYGLTAATLNTSGSAGVSSPGDWDTGPGLMPDGPFINPTEQWNTAGDPEYFLEFAGNSSTYANGNSEGQFLLANSSNGTASLTFSPNRLVSSPVKFGSLATGADPDNPRPWQTLLFCPNPAARITESNSAPTPLDHPGFGNPPDSAYLEFFTMPVVEPYAISEPLSTAGLVNLNYQLEPFTNIERSTALRGVLKSVLMNAISPGDVRQGGPGGPAPVHPTPINGTVAATYKFNLNTTKTAAQNLATRCANETHYNINRDATIAGFDEHFANQVLFRYPSEVCNMFLVPSWIPGATYASDHPTQTAIAALTADNMISGFWSKMTLTGDNLREEPYDRIYPRVCTKSNTYTVHCRVQSLRKAANSKPTVWTEGTDQVVGEYRGSAVVERYVDPDDPRLNSNWDTNTITLSNLGGPADGSASTTPDLSAYYRLRVLNIKKFAP